MPAAVLATCATMAEAGFGRDRPLVRCGWRFEPAGLLPNPRLLHSAVIRRWRAMPDA